MNDKKKFYIIASLCGLLSLFFIYRRGAEDIAFYMLGIWVLKDILIFIFIK